MDKRKKFRLLVKKTPRVLGGTWEGRKDMTYEEEPIFKILAL